MKNKKQAKEDIEKIIGEIENIFNEFYGIIPDSQAIFIKIYWLEDCRCYAATSGQLGFSDIKIPYIGYFDKYDISNLFDTILNIVCNRYSIPLSNDKTFINISYNDYGYMVYRNTKSKRIYIDNKNK